VTAARRDYTVTFADAALMSDLRQAVEDCQGQVCEHAADECDCPENRMLPAEFLAWLEREVLMAQQRPMRFERGHRPRRQKADQLTLAIAG
jgi:hypothetical protein